MAQEIDDSFDLGNDAIKRRLKAYIDHAQGWHRVKIRMEELTRRDKANRKYFAAWVTPFAHYLLEQDEDLHSLEQAKLAAHDELAKHNLGVIRYASPVTGEIHERPMPTHTLSIRDFNDYMEKCAMWLARYVGIVVQDDERVTTQPPRRRQGVGAA